MILEINIPHHYKFMCPLYRHMEALTSSLWMNVVDFIFWLVHICNHPTFSLSTPLCSPYTLFVDRAHLFVDCENTFGDCINFFIDYAHNFDDCVNTFDDLTSIVTDSTNTFDHL
jgi:hypothetical protein